MKEHRYYTYIVASRSGVLYIGLTNNLEKRVREHTAHGPTAWASQEPSEKEKECASPTDPSGPNVAISLQTFSLD